MSNKKMRKNKKNSAKDIFDRYLAHDLQGVDSSGTIDIFCNLDYNNFYNLAIKHKLQERQISSLIGFKDEFFVGFLVNQIIHELGLDEKFYSKKVTANKKNGLQARIIKIDGIEQTITVGGDCVIFEKTTNKPIMIIECKEYIDMIRIKELIGESRIIKDEIDNAINLLGDIKFCVFSEVLELTDGWSYFLKNSDLRHQIDAIFVIQDGKRKDKGNKPVRDNLTEFKQYISDFLTTA